MSTLRSTVSAWPVLVERHHDHGRAVVEADARLVEELVDAFLHRDRVDDRLALHALQAGLDHAELRRVDHHRHAGDVGLAGDQVEERRHRLDAVDQAVVHVDVDDLRAVLDLVAGDVERLGVVVVLDQPAELGRAGDVGALADVDERDVVGQRERLETRQFEPRRPRRHDARRRARRPPPAIAAMCAGVVPQHPPTTLTRPASANSRDEAGRRVRRLVVAAELVGQAGVRVHAHATCRRGRELLDVGPHLLGTERAVEPDRQRLGVTDRLPERGRCLTGQRAAGSIGDRARDHQRQLIGRCSARARRAATMAALALSVSKIVSISSTSTPPSTSASICSWYASASVANVIDR